MHNHESFKHSLIHARTHLIDSSKFSAIIGRHCRSSITAASYGSAVNTGTPSPQATILRCVCPGFPAACEYVSHNN